MEPKRDREPQNNYYDILDKKDYECYIVPSFRHDYNINLFEEDMDWTEFCSLLGGLTDDTILSKIVSIRSERDMSKVREMPPGQRRIWQEWHDKMVKNNMSYYTIEEKKQGDIDLMNSIYRHIG